MPAKMLSLNMVIKISFFNCFLYNSISCENFVFKLFKCVLILLLSIGCRNKILDYWETMYSQKTETGVIF